MKCTAVLNVAGEHFDCDLDSPHDGWGHANKAAQAIWTGTDKEPAQMEECPDHGRFPANKFCPQCFPAG